MSTKAEEASKQVAAVIIPPRQIIELGLQQGFRMGMIIVLIITAIIFISWAIVYQSGSTSGEAWSVKGTLFGLGGVAILTAGIMVGYWKK
jgi:hypothetical protein